MDNLLPQPRRKPPALPTRVHCMVQGPTLRALRKSADNLLGPGEGANIGIGTTAHALILWAMENIPPDIMREILVKAKMSKEVRDGYANHNRRAEEAGQRMQRM